MKDAAKSAINPAKELAYGQYPQSFGMLTSCQVRHLRLNSCIYQIALAVLICAKEYQGSRKGTQQCREHTTIQPPPYALLPPDR